MAFQPATTEAQRTITHPEPSPARPRRRLWRAFFGSPTAVAGAAILIALTLAALLAPVLAPHDPLDQVLRFRLKPPMWMPGGDPSYVLGGDRLGRDILSNLLYGVRVSIAVGFGAVLLSAAIGVPLGLAAGYFGGRTDHVLMRLVDIQMSLPAVLIALGAMSVWGRGLGKLILVIGVIGWAVFARTTRGTVLAAREEEYVQAARASGASELTIMARHILPNVVTPLLILFSVELPRVVMLEATLSFLGVGVPVEVPSLGSMINEGYQVLFSGHWWLSTFPGLLLMALVLGVNLLGDWLRDALDPRLSTPAGRPPASS